MLCTHDISSTGWGETRPGTERQNSGLLGSRPSAEVAEVAQEREFVGTQNTHRHFSSLFSSSFLARRIFTPLREVLVTVVDGMERNFVLFAPN
jgi:hypothetical protein